uniref:ATP-dependent helicase/nuclease subunit A n=1 Tax=Zeugodacus cucurbitae TaxID=28588 RepID=A0A0A1XMW2_ZEUCU
MMLHIFFLAIFIVKLDPAHFHPVEVSDTAIDQHANNISILKEYSYPYYGGLRGQILQVVRTKDGQDNMFIISPTAIPPADVKATYTKKTSVPASDDDIQLNIHPSTSIAFEQDFNRIQIAAARLVAIQEVAKRKGSFSAEDNRIYAESLLELGHAAQKLANLHHTGQIKDFSLLLQPDFQVPHKKPLFPSESISVSETSGGEQKVDEVTEQQFNEEDLLPPNTEDPYEDVSDSVAVTAPKKDASVAEAKPIGLSIAGEGGVASSKPNAIALSGRNGLAVSAPKATAIAGVSAEEAAAFSVSIPNRNNLVIKTVNHVPQRPVYDDYNEDYSDVLPARSKFTRDTTITHGSSLPVVSKKTKGASATEGGSGAVFADSLVQQWKTIVAADYSASARSAPQLIPAKFVKESVKFQQSSIDKKD